MEGSDASYNPAVSHLTPPGVASPHGPPLMAIWKHLEHRNIGLTMILVRSRRPNKTWEVEIGAWVEREARASM